MSDHQPYEEKELLVRIADGDEEAFTLVYNRYKDAIYYTAQKMTSSTVLAEEVIQDVFLKFWIRREKAPGIENIKAYLHTMAENLIFDAVRKQQKEQHFKTTQNEEAFSATPAILLEQKDYALILQNAVNRLPPKQRETYRLIKEQGLKRDQVAGLLKVSPETVKWNLDQAMRSIRAHCLRQLGVSAGIFALLKIYF